MLLVKDMKDLKGKRVIVRVDFNVPQKGGVISDDNRIVAALPTIKDLMAKGARLVLMSHLGKVKHKEAPEVVEEQKKKNNMAPVAVRLGELLGVEVKFCPATRGAELANAVNALKDGEVLLMQNTRYEKGEEKNDPELSKEWAALGDAFVMDAFGSAHRAHASTYGIPEILKAEGKQVAIGYLVEKEVVSLDRVVNVPAEAHPYVAILGGFKVSDKIKVIDSLLKKCDKVIIGGAMAYTFAVALGKKVGSSPFEADQVEYAKRMYDTGKILLPVDSKIANDFDNPTDIRIVEGDIPEGFQGMDIGPNTAKIYAAEIAKAKTVFWNGPMGVFEKDEFTDGTVAVCKACAELKDAFTVIGGGDSASAAKKLGFKEKFSHVSTGGGASLEMIENDGHLPGIDVIK
ncbi:MAG: phosphoglycerate kinase [Bacilli bacterium]|nr:phosphoglycerate kinase [Bacilli bacterium]